MIRSLRKDLKALSTKERAKIVSSFFKTGKGEYGEGDIFIGVRVPDNRKVAKVYAKTLDLESLSELLKSPIHEERLCALIILTDKFEKSKEAKDREHFAKIYLKHLPHVNNWDLVDASASRILGAFLFERDRSVLRKLVCSKVLWDRRVAIVATHYFIKRNDFDWTFSLTEQLLKDSHDLMHKACGWMLREVGKKDEKALEFFLLQACSSYASYDVALCDRAFS